MTQHRRIIEALFLALMLLLVRNAVHCLIVGHMYVPIGNELKDNSSMALWQRMETPLLPSQDNSAKYYTKKKKHVS